MNTAKTLATLAALGLGAALMLPATAEPPATPPKIGLIGDFQSVYSDIGGMGNVEATKMAIEEFGGTMFGKPIELITADAQNRADIAGSLARKWYENEAIDMIIDMPTSATALAGMEMSRQFEKIMIVTDAASSDITGKSCSPYTVHWTYDGPTTPMPTPTPSAAPSSRTAATPGSSSPPTICSKRLFHG